MNTEILGGLTQSEVLARQKKHGFNELPSKEKRNVFIILLQMLKEPIILMLIVTVAVYFAIGDRGEAILLLISVAVIITIDFLQENRTEKSLEALRNLSSPIASVIRGGKLYTVPGRDLVVGDVIILSEGSRVPADARITMSSSLMVDESMLTGESMSVEKLAEASSDSRKQAVFSGTLVVKGHATAVVTAIGQDTEMGDIGKSLKTIETEKTLLQKDVTRVVRIIAIGAVSMAIILVVAYAFLRSSALEGLLAGLTLSIAMLPEEFPVVLTIFLTLGAWRLAKSKVLTRKANTIETLGSANVLCVDKTGTLTENKMRVETIIDSSGKISDEIKLTRNEVLRYGVFASQRKPFDPMDEAFIEAANTSFGSVDTIYEDLTIIKEYPFGEGSFSVVNAWGNSKAGNAPIVALKGAPETVFELCNLKARTIAKLSRQVDDMAHRGLRVIAVAKGEHTSPLPKNREDIKFSFVGMVGLADPIRKEVPSAIKSCADAGIRVIMITGDYPNTALNIANQAGINAQETISGQDFEALSEHEQKDVIKRISVFSRVTPSTKLAIVKALKAKGDIVAMTGDGVNDAPALKSAHIGIAMGKKGTDVAREAAAIVLLDDNFSSIIQGVRLGRRIYDNLKNAMSYILTVHVPIAALSLMPVFLGWPAILIPVHIVFLEFIIDPSSTIVFENEKEADNVMNRPPRKLNQSIFSRGVIISSIATGIVVSIVLVSIYGLLLRVGYDYNHARTIIFIAMVVSNLLVIVGVSGRRVIRDLLKLENKAMIAVIAVAASALTAVTTIPTLRDLFRFEPLDFGEVLLSIALGSTSLIVILIVRFIGNQIDKRYQKLTLSRPANI